MRRQESAKATTKMHPVLPRFSSLVSYCRIAIIGSPIYETPVVGPHGYSEYAPPGYETRDYQDAPGVPEFILITPPVRVTAEERQ